MGSQSPQFPGDRTQNIGPRSPFTLNMKIKPTKTFSIHNLNDESHCIKRVGTNVIYGFVFVADMFFRENTNVAFFNQNM